jgi:hypothetical protein
LFWSFNTHDIYSKIKNGKCSTHYTVILLKDDGKIYVHVYKWIICKCKKKTKKQLHLKGTQYCSCYMLPKVLDSDWPSYCHDNYTDHSCLVSSGGILDEDRCHGSSFNSNFINDGRVCVNLYKDAIRLSPQITSVLASYLKKCLFKVGNLVRQPYNYQSGHRRPYHENRDNDPRPIYHQRTPNRNDLYNYRDNNLVSPNPELLAT